VNITYLLKPKPKIGTEVARPENGESALRLNKFSGTTWTISWTNQLRLNHDRRTKYVRGTSQETGQNHSYNSGSKNTVASCLCGRASCDQHRRIKFWLLYTHTATHAAQAVHSTCGPSCARTKLPIICAHAAKLCYTLQRCATRGQAVQHAADAKFTVHTRPSCASRCKAVQHAAKCKIHCAHVAKVCNTLQSCATRSQCKILSAYAAKLCYTLQRCARGRGQCKIHCAHAAKLCYTLQSCARGCSQCKIHCAHVAKLCYTLQSCARGRSQVLQHAADAISTVNKKPSCAMRPSSPTGCQSEIH
jgi:hypothetical protein